MARTKRIWRESQHPRDAKGRFSRRGGAAWIKRAAAELTSAADSAATRDAAGRPRISRAAKAGVVLQAHADGGRPSAVRVPQAVKSAAPSPKNLADFNAQRLPTPVKRAAPQPKNLAAFNAPDAPGGGGRAADIRQGDYVRVSGEDQYGKPITLTGYAQGAPGPVRIGKRGSKNSRDMVAVQVSDTPSGGGANFRGTVYAEPGASIERPQVPQKRTPRAAPGAAAFRAARAEEQAPQMAAMVAARTAPETAPVPGAENYAAMRRHTLLSLARDAGVSIRGKTNTQIANELAAHDAKVKADRAAKLNPSGVGVDTPRVGPQDGGMTSTTPRKQVPAAAKREALNPPLSPEQKAIYDKMLGTGDDKGLVQNPHARRIVEQMEAHGWELTAQDSMLRMVSFRAPDGRELHAQFLLGDRKPQFRLGQGIRSQDITFKAALAHVITPHLAEEQSPNVSVAMTNVGLPMLHAQGWNDRPLASRDPSYRPLQQVSDDMARPYGGGTPKITPAEAVARLRQAAETNRKVADDRKRYNDMVLGGNSVEDQHSITQRQRADEFERVADEMEKMAERRAAYEAERDRRAALPPDIRPGRSAAKKAAKAPAKKAAAPVPVEAPTPAPAPRSQIPRDAKTQAIEDQRAGMQGIYQRHARLTRAEFDAMPETERERVLADLRKVSKSGEEESYTIPSNRSSMGMTVRGRREAAHVKGAKDKFRELTYTAPPPVDNSVSGRAARLKAGDVRAIDNATIADLNEIAREAGLSGGASGWPRQKLVDYIRNQVAVGDRLKVARSGDLAEALRGATPGEVLAVLDARESEGGVTMAEMKAAAKTLGVKVSGDKRSIRNGLAKGAGAAPPKAEAAREAAPADATAVKRAASLEKARAAATEKKVGELRTSDDPRDNSAKIRAITDGRMESADLYRQIHAGPSGQRKNHKVGRVRHTPDNQTGEYTVTAPGGERVGYATSVVRNGDQQYAVYSDNGDGGTELLGWADTLAHAADVLTNGEAAASTGGTLDARRISGRMFERNPNRNKSLEQLDREALDREIAQTREYLAKPELMPTLRARAERRLANLEAERRGEPETSVDTPRVKSQNGGMTTTTNAPAKPKSKLAPTIDAAVRVAVEMEEKLGPPPKQQPHGIIYGSPEWDAAEPVRAEASRYRTAAHNLQRTSGHPKPGLGRDKARELGLIEWDPATGYDRPTEAGRQHVATTSPAGPVKKAKKPEAGTVVQSTGDRPRTGTYTGDIQANRAERLNNKEFTDHVKTLTLTVNHTDDVRAHGFDTSDRPVQVGDEVMVHTFDRFRRGIVTQTTRGGASNGTTRIAYATPTGGYAQETTTPTAHVYQLVDPSRRPRENRAALLPRIEPEARPRRMSEEDRAAAAEARKTAEKAAAAKRRQDFFDSKINGITEALENPNGVGVNPPEWYLQMTTEEGLVSLAKHLKVKVPNREQGPYGPKSRTREQVDAIRRSIIDAIRARSAEGKA